MRQNARDDVLGLMMSRENNDYDWWLNRKILELRKCECEWMRNILYFLHFTLPDNTKCHNHLFDNERHNSMHRRTFVGHACQLMGLHGPACGSGFANFLKSRLKKKWEGWRRIQNGSATNNNSFCDVRERVRRRLTMCLSSCWSDEPNHEAGLLLLVNLHCHGGSSAVVVRWCASSNGAWRLSLGFCWRRVSDVLSCSCM